MNGETLQVLNRLNSWFSAKFERHYTKDMGDFFLKRYAGMLLVARDLEMYKLAIQVDPEVMFGPQKVLNSARTLFTDTYEGIEDILEMCSADEQRGVARSVIEEYVQPARRSFGQLQSFVQCVATRSACITNISDSEIDSIVDETFGGVKEFSLWLRDTHMGLHSVIEYGNIRSKQTKSTPALYSILTIAADLSTDIALYVLAQDTQK